MKINKMLKLTLSALLLAASSSAYAQEGAVVRLKDGQTVTWQAFGISGFFRWTRKMSGV